jgi:hypothetical protein
MRNISWLLVLVLATLGYLAATNLAIAADLEIGDLTITPPFPKEGDQVTITCVVTNKGNQKVGRTLELRINGEVQDTKELSLNPGESKELTFSIIAGTAGEYAVELNGESTTFTVEPTTSFWGMFLRPPLVIIVGAILGVLVLLIIVVIAMPPRKKQPQKATLRGREMVDRRLHDMPSQRPPYQEVPPMPTAMPGPMPSPRHGQFSVPPEYPPPYIPGRPSGPFAPPGPVPTPRPAGMPYSPYASRPIFSVSNLTISPNQVKAGQPVTIGALVTNSGNETGRYSLVLRINGIVEGITELTLPPGASQAASFTVVKETGGDYYAEVDGLGGSFTVVPLAPASFSVSNLIISPDRVKQGENVTISVMVTNSGEVSGSYSVVLKIKGTVEAVEEVHLGPNSSERVTFNVVKNTPGFYNVEVEGLTGRFVVEMEWQG